MYLKKKKAAQSFGVHAYTACLTCLLILWCTFLLLRGKDTSNMLMHISSNTSKLLFVLPLCCLLLAAIHPTAGPIWLTVLTMVASHNCCPVWAHRLHCGLCRLHNGSHLVRESQTCSLYASVRKYKGQKQGKHIEEKGQIDNCLSRLFRGAAWRNWHGSGKTRACRSEVTLLRQLPNNYRNTLTDCCHVCICTG